MSTVNLQHVTGATAQIHPYGAHITSWKTADGKQRLFLSERSEFKSGVAIRGGVPVVFPQFSNLGSLPKHGFARTMLWQPDADKTTNSIATFGLSHSPHTLAIWPFRFTATYQVTLGVDELSMQLTVRNDDDKAFSFTTALHTYLRVTNINAVSVSGLRGYRYRDSANGNLEQLESAEEIHFAGEVDRIYMSTLSPVLVSEPECAIQCSAQGFNDTVLWNPGALLSKKLSDMDDEGYRYMVCVEAANIASPVKLLPAEYWQGTQVLAVK